MSQSFTQPDLRDRSARQVGVVSITGTPPLPTGAATEATLATLAQEGTSISGASMPIGGQHLMGWLSAIWKALTDRLPAALVGGRLDTSSFLASTSTTGSFTAVAQSVSLACAGYGALNASVSGTYTGGAWVHEISDDGGTTWFQVFARRSQEFTVDLNIGTLDNTNRLYYVDIAGATHYRLRCTNYSSGTIAVHLTANASSPTRMTAAALVDPQSGNTPITSQQVGGNRALHVAGGTIQSGATTGNVTASGQTVAISASASTAFIVALRGTYLGLSFVFEATPDGTNYYPVVGVRTDTGTVDSGGTGWSNAVQMWEVYAPGQNTFRVRSTALSSGTANVTLIAVGLAAPSVVTVQDGGGALTIDGSISATIPDGNDGAAGSTADAESSSGAGTIIALLKRLRTLLNGGLPAALGGDGGLKVEAIQTLTKGTQGGTGFSTQALKDAGRTYVALTADAVTPAAITDTLITFVKNVGGTETTGQTTYTVTTGKTLRLQALLITFAQSGTTAARVRVYLRATPSGTPTTASPKLAVANVASNGFGTSAANLGGDTVALPFPDGLELAAGAGLALSALATSANGTLSISLIGYEY